MVGNQPSGQTDAYQYFHYTTRGYLDIQHVSPSHPYFTRLNKVLLLYEDNEIFAMGEGGKVMGVDMVEDGDTATHPFVIYNNANEVRTYRIWIQAGDNIAVKVHDNRWNVWVDDDKDGVKDPSETTELVGEGTVTLQPHTDLSLVGLHTPGWQETNAFHNRRSADAGVTIQELDRLRMASYHVRTWEGSAAEVADKSNILPTLTYHQANSHYEVHAQWNQDKPNNMRLVRNSPDYQMALAKMGAGDTTPPVAPQNLGIQ